VTLKRQHFYSRFFSGWLFLDNKGQLDSITSMIVRKKIHILILAASLTGGMLYLSCTSTPGKGTPQSIRFAVLNNTSPQSPYAAFPESVPAALAQIQHLNPVFIMHTGNIIHGGFSWMGIRIADMEKQYQQFFSHAKNLSSLVYTTVGPLDALDGDTSLYSRYTDHAPYYSFNYGNTHFVVLNSNEKKPAGISPTQYSWLTKDLEESSLCCTIMVFIYHCPLNKPRGRNSRPEPAFQDGAKLHELFTLYGVTSVFSSDGKRRSSFSHEKVTYNQLPCVFPEKKGYGRNNQYYIIDAAGENTDITEHSIY